MDKDNSFPKTVYLTYGQVARRINDLYDRDSDGPTYRDLLDSYYAEDVWPDNLDALLRGLIEAKLAVKDKEGRHNVVLYLPPEFENSDDVTLPYYYNKRLNKEIEKGVAEINAELDAEKNA